MKPAPGTGDAIPDHCEIGMPDGSECPSAADVKLADGSGVAAWSCAVHADEVLITARGVFIAGDEPDGLAAFLAARGRRTQRTRIEPS
ncbi:hypothetical protein [Cryptosporangium aurantiacum]|uniref:Uncharacterized protein n=1 Tax=Cryptosporangium aurantiacum TaxID=134849 RepID=A0A1M7RMV2_9ACTN|nr:hypothetical protein [Cryptosporangium aurantiacum]SHN47539.1 hypothetical protein SAMN05443668_12497 [Cryptosporangium aurantiacum]